MKKCRGLISLCTALCLMAMLVPASASSVKASDKIYLYFIDVGASNGEIVTQFTVMGNVTMEQLGCQRIKIYEKFGNSWIPVVTFDENDIGMSRTNALQHSNLVSWSCQSGMEYRVDVTVFAEDSAGRDTRSKTVYVTGK